MAQRTEEEWQIREKELLEKIASLENNQKNLMEEYQKKHEIFAAVLTKSKEEIIGLEKKLTILDKELVHKQMTGGDEVDKRDDLLRKAKSLLFEQTKISKNQEMQLEALNTQVASLQEVLTVTREMLEIRNTEIDHMKTRMESVELRLKTERDLMERRFTISEKMYKNLKQEHDLQSGLFKELKGGYQSKIEILRKELGKQKSIEAEK